MPKTDIQSICIVRLSAIGDVTHVLPVVHTLQQQNPDLHITWIIGRVEAQLVGDLQGIEFIEFDKKSGASAFFKLRRQLQDRRFDVVLGMQVSLRANLITGLLRSKRKIGFDRQRSKDLHGWFINERIGPQNGHVLDGFFQFVEYLGFTKDTLDWSIPIPPEAQQFAQQQLPVAPILAISPCSSHPLRNWKAEYYAKIANYAHHFYGFKIVLLGGKSTQERHMGDEILRHLNCESTDLIGKDTLKKLLALLQATSVLLTPDSGPAHMAACVDTPVIGLYAASNPARSGPYKSQQWCVNAYPLAARLYLKKDSARLRWGRKIETPGVMDLIEPADVLEKLDLLAATLGLAKIA